MSGLFELLNPSLVSVDGMLGDISVAIRLLIWGAIGGLASMVLYWLTSPQNRLKQIADELRSVKRLPNTADEQRNARDTMRMLKMNIQRLGLTFGPALISAIPILFMFGYLNGAYGMESPVPGEPVAILSGDGGAIQVEGGQRFSAGWTVPWPESDAQVRVFDSKGQPYLFDHYACQAGDGT